MKTIISTAKNISFIAILVIAFLSCDKPTTTEPVDLKGNISGKVTSLNGTVIEGASVTAEGLDEVFTNSEGVFTYTEVAAESYTLKATKAGYLDGSEEIRVVGDKTVDVVIEIKEGAKPNVTTQTVTDIYMTIAEVSGKVASIGDDDVLAYGHCWSTNSAPTIADNSSNFGSTNQNSPFTTSLENLKAGTQYYVRAYASNIFGITYSRSETFETLPGEPTVATNAASEIEFNRAEITGNLSGIGASAVTQHGHVWSKTQNPTLDDFKTELGAKTETGIFTSIILDLEMETTYYIRAYAINEDGMTYSNQESFTTSDKFKDKRDQKWYHVVKIGEQIWMKENLSNYTSEALCYANNAANCSVMGALYDWNSAQTIAPEGWHLPSEAEWNTLITLYGGEAVAGGKLKDADGGFQISTYWQAPHTGATDESGFSARGAGYFNATHQSLDLHISTSFWMSDNINTENGRCVKLDINSAGVSILDYPKTYSFSVRCVLD